MLTPPSVAYLGLRRGVASILFCCEEGSCRTRDCDRLIAVGEEIALERGGVVKVQPAEPVACAGTREGVRPSFTVDPIPEKPADALWPPSLGRDARWRSSDYVTRVVEATVEDAGALGLEPEDLPYTGFRLTTLDLDDDGRAEELLAVGGKQPGLYLRTHGEAGTVLRRLHDGSMPDVHAAIDLDGDGMRELILIVGHREPPDLAVVDIKRGAVLLRTPWLCEARPERH